ncbi:MAG: glycerate kinase [Candidatus Brocadia sp.]|nr:glycerate kinase [Candidatus Brocadia sp.]
MNQLNTLRAHTREIFYAGLRAVEPSTCMRRHIHLDGSSLRIGEVTYRLNTYKDIYVVGFGKASGFMAVTLEELLGERIKAGIVNIRYGYHAPCKIIKINMAGHPVPDEAGIKGTIEIVHLLRNAEENDLVICLISGGGSALFELPCDGISLGEVQEITELLLKSGAGINEVNTIRKHISQVKGGRLAKMCKAEIASLILSDVVNNQPDTIASGPTLPDYSTFLDCEKIFMKYELFQKIPVSIRMHIQKGLDGKIKETPKFTDKIFDKVYNVIIGNNRMALEASYNKAMELGYHTVVLTSYLNGEAREVARVYGAIAKEIYQTGNPAERPACIIAGGETTVTVKGDGKGGRNQEFVLSAAMEINGLENTVIFSAGTDGIDGNTDAAGAIADGFTVARAKSIAMNPEAYLGNNDSYSFFKGLNDQIVTGPTKTNVMDIMLLLVK